MSFIVSFDLWMSKGAYDVFALVINFLDENWQPKKVKIGFSEVIEKIGQVLARNQRELSNSYGLSKKIIVYVKDEGVDLNSMTPTFKYVVNCEVLGLEESFNGTCFGHAFSKTYQYATPKQRVCKNLNFVSMKYVQFDIQNCIT